MNATLSGLVRVRRGVRCALVLGILASLTANVLHAEPNTVSRVISAWPPAALVVTIELISRVPVASKRLASIRIAATTVVAGIAAWVSYFHMVDVALRFGETSTAAHLIPFSVDGLIVVASACLVEINRLVRELGNDTPELPPATGEALPSCAVDATTPTVSLLKQSGFPTPGAGVATAPQTNRDRLLQLVADHPDSAGMSTLELAEMFGPQVGLRASTARKYISSTRNGGGDDD